MNILLVTALKPATPALSFSNVQSRGQRLLSGDGRTSEELRNTLARTTGSRGAQYLGTEGAELRFYRGGSRRAKSRYYTVAQRSDMHFEVAMLTEHGTVRCHTRCGQLSGPTRGIFGAYYSKAII